jgi:hypothetical protein
LEENAIVNMVRVLWSPEAGGALVDLAFYDREAKPLLKTYSFDMSKKEPGICEHLVELEEDERVVGFCSKQSEKEPGHHFDFRLQIAKLVCVD